MMTATGFDGIAKGSLDRLERKAVRLNQPQARRKANDAGWIFADRTL
jgi:hypothetical protein